MINYETILSTADNKLTLMKWLQKVEDALKNASLESVSATQPTTTTMVLTFHFADGTSLVTDSLSIPTGPEGPEGPEGPQGVSITNIEITNGEVFVTLSNGNVIDAGYIGEGVPDAQYDFLDEEYKKTLNLLCADECNAGYILNANGEYVPEAQYPSVASPTYVPVSSSNISWTFESSYISYEDRFYRICCYDENKNHIERLTGKPTSTNVTRRLPSGTKYIRLGFDAPNRTQYKFMVVEGDTSLPYQPYNGPITHAIDVKGALLWLNGNPTTSFSAQTITIPDTTAYKRLRFVFRWEAGSSDGDQDYIVETSLNRYFYFSNANAVADVVIRNARLISDTSVNFGDGYRAGSQNNTAMIPVAVYGLK